MTQPFRGDGDDGRTRLTRRFTEIDVRITRWLARYGVLISRLGLGLIFLWFGVLKLTGDSPVLALVSATVPWVDPYLLMHLLGAVEVLLAVGLLLGRAQRLLLLVLAGHLSGTFLTFVMAPQLMVQHGRPLLLTADGEFVLKNLVLISAALLLAARVHPASWSPNLARIPGSSERSSS